MTNSFAVTSLATEPLKLDRSGKATVVFTVTNTTSKPLRGLAKVKALGNTKQEWLSIAGETERDFPAGGTQQFAVDFNSSAPSAATASPLQSGKYEFRLNVASSANSDEDFTESSPVVIEVPQLTPPPPPNLWRWIIPAIAIVLIVLAASAWFLLSPKDTRVEVPDATQQLYVDAVKLLEAQGFKQVERKDIIAADKKPNLVVNQTPSPKEKVKDQDAKIILEVVSTSKVPPLKDLTFVQAFDELRKSGLEIGNVSGDREIFVNVPQKIVSQDPEVGKEVAKGSAVNISFPCFPPFRCIKLNIDDLNQIRVKSQRLNESEVIRPIR